MKYDSEEKYVDYIISTLEKLNYNVWKEVVPDQCVTWERPYRVDLVIYHPTEGYIGIEAKNINTLRQGAVLSNAITQIQNYKQFTYSGIKINKWCIAVPEVDYNYLNKDETMREVKSFVINFIKKRYNISFMNELVIDECTKNRIDFHQLESKTPTVAKLKEFNMESFNGIDIDCPNPEIEWECKRCCCRNYNGISPDTCECCNSTRYICEDCDSDYDIEDEYCPSCSVKLGGIKYE